MQKEKKNILIAIAMLLGIAGYICVMLFFLLHEEQSKEIAPSRRQVTIPPQKEEVTAVPAKPIVAEATKAAKFIIAKENLQIPEELQVCAANFRKIHSTIKKYEKDKGKLPNWLSDLVPEYLSAETLFCPHDAKHKSPYLPDPRLPCSYGYEFSSARIPKGSDPTGRTQYRDWKTQQIKLFGDVVPVVRCHHHGSKRVLNLSAGGQIWWGRLGWELMFKRDYRFGDELSGRSLRPERAPTQKQEAEAPMVSQAEGIEPGLSKLPERRRLVASGWKASWSPDGTCLVFGKLLGKGLQILDLESGKTTDLTSSGKDAAWSPDGRFIAYVNEPSFNAYLSEEVYLVRPTGGSPRKLMDGGFPHWSADGKTLFVQSRKENKILAIDVNNPDTEPNVFFDGPQSWYPAVSPDGKQIAFGKPGALVVVDRKSGETVLTWATPGSRGLLPAWSPDGKRIAFGSFSRLGLWVFDVKTQKAVKVAREWYTMPAWSTDGSKLAFDLRQPGAPNEIWMVQTKALATLEPSRPTAAEPADVKAQTSPDKLNLSGTKTTDADLARRLEGLTSLESLQLGATRITDAGLGHLKNLTALQSLCVHKTQVTDAGLAHLKGLTRLQSLCLNDTQVSDAGLFHLKGLTSLRQLNLLGTKASTAGVAELKRALPNCRISGPRAPTAGRAESPLIGKLAPSFTLKDLNGKQVSLSDFKGKVVILDFWATWCGPCARAIPHVESLHKKYKDQGLVVIGINNERDHVKVKAYAKERISYIILLDADKQFRQYGARSIPTAFYINRDGMIRYRDVGFGPGKEKEMERKVKELLGR